MNVKGLYLRRTGRLCLFSNAISPHFGIHLGANTRVVNTTTQADNDNGINYKKRGNHSVKLNSGRGLEQLSVRSYKTTRRLKEAVTKKKNKNLRPVPLGKNLCFFRMDFN